MLKEIENGQSVQWSTEQLINGSEKKQDEFLERHRRLQADFGSKFSETMAKTPTQHWRVQLPHSVLKLKLQPLVILKQWGSPNSSQLIRCIRIRKQITKILVCTLSPEIFIKLRKILLYLETNLHSGVRIRPRAKMQPSWRRNLITSQKRVISNRKPR